MQKVLEMIREVIKKYNNNNLVLNNLTDIENYVKEELLKEKVSETSSLNVYNTIKKILKKASKIRPILGNVLYKNECMYFTDSYSLFALKNNDIITDLPSESKENYPHVDNIINDTLMQINNQVEYNCEDLKKQLKVCSKDCFIINIKDINIYIDSQRLKDAITILKFKNKDNIVINFNENQRLKPIVIQNDNGSIALIMPLNKPEKENKEENK